MAKVKTRLERLELYEFYKIQYPDSLFVTPNNWRYMVQGPERRKLLLQFLKDNGTVPVNNKWQANTHHDPDIKRLLKRGIIKMKKIGELGKRQTYIMLNN